MAEDLDGLFEERDYIGIECFPVRILEVVFLALHDS